MYTSHLLFLWLIWIPYIMFIIIFPSMKSSVQKIFLVVCFNDFSWATLINPPTTTVKQDVGQICKEAFCVFRIELKKFKRSQKK